MHLCHSKCWMESNALSRPFDCRTLRCRWHRYWSGRIESRFRHTPTNTYRDKQSAVCERVAAEFFVWPQHNRALGDMRTLVSGGGGHRVDLVSSKVHGPMRVPLNCGTHNGQCNACMCVIKANTLAPNSRWRPSMRASHH